MEKLRSEERGQIPTKKCGMCQKLRATTTFHKNKNNIDGLQSRCKVCRQGESFERKYGITIQEWDLMFIDQCGRCAICEVDLPAMGRGVHTDHSHAHGGVRGLLCSDCNPALGGLKDNPNLLRKAAEYIENDVEKSYEPKKCIRRSMNMGIHRKIQELAECLVCTVVSVIIIVALVAVIISLGVVG